MGSRRVLSTLLFLSVTSRIDMQYYEFIPEYYPYMSRPPTRSDPYRPIQHTFVSSPRYNTNMNTDRSQERRYNTDKATQDSRRTSQTYNDNNFYEEEDTFEDNPLTDYKFNSSHPAKNTNTKFKNSNNNYYYDNIDTGVTADNVRSNSYPRRDSGVKISEDPRRHFDEASNARDPYKPAANQPNHRPYNERNNQEDRETNSGDNRHKPRYTTTTKSYHRTRPDQRRAETTPHNFYYESETPGPYIRPQYDSPTYTTLRPQYDRPTYNTQRPQYEDKTTSTTSRLQYDNRPTYNTQRSQYEDRTTSTTSRPQYDNRPTYNTQSPQYEEKRTSTTSRPQYNNRPTYNTQRPQYDYRPTYTTLRPTADRRPVTQGPFYVPGVKPATTRGPPITNKPPHNGRKPDGSIRFPDEDAPPTFGPGPDVELMTEAQRRRYADMTEKLCDTIKALDTSEVAAIPLLPSPRPVRVNVTACAGAAPLIVGGRAVGIEQLPHCAALGWRKVEGPGYSWKCGGSLVSDRWVLTAAHCAWQERDTSVSIGAPRAVQLGSARLDDPGALVLRVTRAVRHPRYAAPAAYHDTALLLLERRVTFSALVRPACVGGAPAAGARLVAAGWGRTEFGGDTSTELRAVSLPVWDMDACARALGTSRKLPRGPDAASQLCAGEERGGRDTCQGDSGGGAVQRAGCAWRAAAVTSLGRACAAPATPAVYATVDAAFVGAVLFGGI